MRKTLLVCCLVLSLALIAGCGKKPENTVNIGDGKGKVEQTMEKFSGSMRDLLMKGQAVKCDYMVSNDGFAQNNTLYISGKKMRMDGITKMAGQADIKNHMIVADNTQYFWNEDGTGKGTKMQYAETPVDQGNTEVQEQNTKIDMDVKMEMNCEKWSEDSGVFIPPGNIQFNDFGEMMKNIGTPGGMCKTCDYLSGDDKKTCQTNFCK